MKKYRYSGPVSSIVCVDAAGQRTETLMHNGGVYPLPECETVARLAGLGYLVAIPNSTPAPAPAEPKNKESNNHA